MNLSKAAQALWAKKSAKESSKWLPLYVHLEDTAGLAEKLWEHWLSPGVKQALYRTVLPKRDAKQLFIFLAAAHDIGKATPVFQAKPALRNCKCTLDAALNNNLELALPMLEHNSFSNPQKSPHALASMLLAQKYGCHKNIAVILGAHHGRPPNRDMLERQTIGAYPQNYHINALAKPAWEQVQEEIFNYALSLSKVSSLNELPLPKAPAQVLLSGLLILADWLASSEAEFPLFLLEEPIQYDKTQRINNAWKLSPFLTTQWVPSNAYMEDNLYKRRFGFLPRPMQVKAAELAAKLENPGIIILEAPMGAGKTEAALAVAEILANKTARTGIFFALPTQATSDGIFPRMISFIENLESGTHSIRLAHAKAQFNEHNLALSKANTNTGMYLDDEDGAVVLEWFKGTKRALLSDFVVGTIDQLLMAALKHKHIMLRHVGLANKVVIIDECHAYDAYMSQYLDMALRWLGAYNVPVIVLSATLPKEKRDMVVNAYLQKQPEDAKQDYSFAHGIAPAPTVESDTETYAYPLITYTEGQHIKSEPIAPTGSKTKVHTAFIDEAEITLKLKTLLCDGGSAGVIVNTVKHAQALARGLKEAFGEGVVTLIHSRFLAEQRAALEAALLEELGPLAIPRKEARIIVGTQVLEQSLDIDFDVLITEICPMDLLLQRIGRLHRHNRVRPEQLKKAFCFITGVKNNGLSKGSVAVYSEYPLLKTLALIKDELIIPDDIAPLVERAYKTGGKTVDTALLKEAEAAWLKRLEQKKQSAMAFRVSLREGDEDISGWLQTGVREAEGEAAVRDGEDSLEVLLVERYEGGMRMLNNNTIIPTNTTPEDVLAKALARQLIRLPPVLCRGKAIGDTITQLEEITRELSLWQASLWLKGSLCLILNEERTASLGGYRLKYDDFYGLSIEKEEDANE